MGKYDDIINMPRYVSKKHPQMSLEMRSAQFAPFAALTGFGEMIIEAARLTDDFIELGEEVAKKECEADIKTVKEKVKGREVTLIITNDEQIELYKNLYGKDTVINGEYYDAYLMQLVL